MGDEYTREHGSYYLRHEGLRILLMTDRVAMAFSVTDIGVVLHKHGDHGLVERWITASRKKLMDADTDAATELAAEMGMITFPRGFDVEEINRCLSTSGYLGTILKRADELELING